MNADRIQIGTVEITRWRVYPIDPLAQDGILRTDVLVPPGEYPVFRTGDARYWQMSGTINGQHEPRGDGMYIMCIGDVATPDEVVFYSRRFGPAEWAKRLSEAERPGSVLRFHPQAGADR